jgi:hypothetical protein
VAEELALVDAVTSAAVVRLDLNDRLTPGQWYLASAPSLSPPDLDRATAGTLISDGQPVTSSAFGNRTIVLPLKCDTTTSANREQVKAARMATLAAELNRDRPVLRWRPSGGSAYTFYRLYRSPSIVVENWDPAHGVIEATAMIVAEPYGLGLPVVLGATTAPENANAYFETDDANWTAVSGTKARSTLQAHEGIASLLITPDGVGTPHADSEKIGDGTSIAGRGFRATAWLRSGSTPTVGPRINFYDAAQNYLTTLGAMSAIVANTWTAYDTGTLFAPANAVYRQIIASYAGVPTVGQTLNVDEAKMWATGEYQVANDPAAAVNGCYLDVTGVTGDVETPAKIEVSGAGVSFAAVFAVRRHGTPGNVAPVVQCESMTQGTDTTVGADAAMSNGSRSRCTFGTNAGMATRLTGTFPSAGGAPYTDRRGLYRMFLVVASSAAGSVYAVRMVVDAQYGAARLLTGDTVTYTATDTSRRLVDLGLVQVPLGQDPVSDGYGPEKEVSSVAVQLQAQRVSGVGSLDMDYAAAMFADQEQCHLGTAQATSGAYDLVLDGVTGKTWMPWASTVGEVHGYGSSPVPKAGGIPMLTPGGQTNRILVLRPDGIGTGWVRGPDTKTRTLTLRVTYWPRRLVWAP